MIRILERIGLSLIIFAAANVYGLVRIFSNSFIIIPVLVLFIIANILPELKKCSRNEVEGFIRRNKSARLIFNIYGARSNVFDLVGS